MKVKAKLITHTLICFCLKQTKLANNIDCYFRERKLECMNCGGLTKCNYSKTSLQSLIICDFFFLFCSSLSIHAL